jgi:ATP synthase protein I
MPWIQNRPLRTVIWWQILFTIIAALASGLLIDLRSATSALLGGLISVTSSFAFAVIVSRHKGFTAGGTLRTALRAEAVKIIVTVLLLWLVFVTYEEVNTLVFIGTFTIAVIVNSMALLVSDKAEAVQNK